MSPRAAASDERLHITIATDDDARGVIESVTGPMDRPWDTRAAVALFWVRHRRLPWDPTVDEVEAALIRLGYPLVERDPDKAAP